ncbi:MAG: ABC transporter ATP-binding protein/permease [Candidatus Pacebacteria bacterium]|nr:ABC transporter ATP-binding protein/permease [Candidatus Paceibacterota bacterium]
MTKASTNRSELQKSNFKILLPYLWPRDQPGLRTRVVFSLLFLLLAKFVTLLVPFFYKFAVDSLSVTLNPTTLVTPASGLGAWLGSAVGAMSLTAVGLVVAYGAARVASQAFGEFRDMIFAKVSQRAVRSIGVSTFRHIHNLSMRFHLDRQTGGLSRTIERGTKGIEYILQFTLLNILPTILEIALVTIFLLMMFDWPFAVITLGTILVYGTFTIMITEWRTQFRRDMNEKDSEANSKAVDSLLNYETVKYFNNEEHEANRFDKAMRGYETAAVHSLNSLGLLNIGQGLIIAVGLIGVMGLSAFEVSNNRMTIGDFVMVNTFLIQLYLPLNFLGFVYRQMRQSLGDMEQMFKLLRVDQEIADRPNAPELKVTKGLIEFDNVGFAYDPRRPILQGISFTVTPGSTVAIVGSSGAGKSTLSRLLYRFYEASSGRIMIDGQSITGVTQSSLRRAIGIVPQDTVLFNDTIYYNIVYGRPDATASEVEEAARLARIHDFIMALPDGYQTKVGERGLKLSGGEKQRVAIARVILKRPHILIFDEATSALDTKTEREIQESLDQVSENHSTLVIAHRLSTIVRADEILVLEAGAIVERGKHSQLLALKGRYATMWNRQLQAHEVEKG